MARNNKVSMPSSTAGITRYFDEYQSKVKLKPGHVIILCVVVIVLTLLMHVYGRGLLG